MNYLSGEEEDVAVGPAGEGGGVGVDYAGDLLGGELAQHGGDVGGIGGHQLADGALDVLGHAARNHGDELLGGEREKF